jgi:uncharacterized protein involved in outer membrane biogenesis
MEFRDLLARSGESDISGNYVSQRGDDRPHFTAELQSRRLRAADLGPRAAGRARPPEGPPRLLSGTPIPLQGLRLRDGKVSYRADELVAGPVTLNQFELRLGLDAGVLTAQHIAAATSGDGTLGGELRFDARREVPAASVSLRFAKLAFGELMRGKGPVPHLEAPLGGRLQLAGEGRSLRELFAHADGEFLGTLSEGTMRASLAEALGFDLRAVGLRMSGSQESLPLRCGVAHLVAVDGKVGSRRFLLDTGPVVLRGEGGIDLATEALDLRFRGQPKQMRFRLRTALEVKGWLADPSPRIEAGRTSGQAGAALALGALVAPAAAAAAFVDPGFARDQDCAALLASVKGP